MLTFVFFFFFNDTATTEIYTLSLHDALPISCSSTPATAGPCRSTGCSRRSRAGRGARSEEHTSELQSPCNLVCRLLLEKKKNKQRQVFPSRGGRQPSQASFTSNNDDAQGYQQ